MRTCKSIAARCPPATGRRAFSTATSSSAMHPPSSALLYAASAPRTSAEAQWTRAYPPRFLQCRPLRPAPPPQARLSTWLRQTSGTLFGTCRFITPTPSAIPVEQPGVGSVPLTPQGCGRKGSRVTALTPRHRRSASTCFAASGRACRLFGGRAGRCQRKAGPRLAACGLSRTRCLRQPRDARLDVDQPSRLIPQRGADAIVN